MRGGGAGRSDLRSVHGGSGGGSNDDRARGVETHAILALITMQMLAPLAANGFQVI
jgi:hypothetical protein